MKTRCADRSLKNWLVLIVPLGALLVSSGTIQSADVAGEEDRFIHVLESSDAGPREKDAACARLKLIGTAHSVPALAALLLDEQLSDSARYALEPMQAPEAGQALMVALAKTKGAVRVGIINSLGVREQNEAVLDLSPLLGDADPQTAGAAARALGRIGGPDAVTALRACARNSAPGVHEAAVDALLRCANRMLANGQRSFALAVFEQLDAPNAKEAVRVAAFRGRVWASGNAGLDMVLHAITGPAGPSQAAALQLARGLQVAHTTRELARLLPALQPSLQSALIDALAQRGDVSVVPLLRTFAATASPETWGSIIRAFDALGDASVVPLLAGWAASGAADIQTPARRALADLHRGNVTQALLDQLGKANAATQAEVARALGARCDTAAVPRLVDLAQHAPGAVRKGALQALSMLVESPEIPAMVDLVLHAKDQENRSQAVEALNSACQRIETRPGHAEVGALVDGFEKGSSEGRSALLPVCSGLVDVKVRGILRAAIHDPDPQVQVAAVRALCDTIDGDLLPDILQLARAAQDDLVRSVAIAGGVRLVTQEDTVKLTSAQRVASLKLLLACASGPEQKRKVLAGLGEVEDPESLAIIEGTLDDPDVRNEAARAVVKVAAALPRSQAMLCKQALKRALVSADDKATRDAVEAALNQVMRNR